MCIPARKSLESHKVFVEIQILEKLFDIIEQDTLGKRKTTLKTAFLKSSLDDSFVLQAYLAQEPSFASQSVLWDLFHCQNNNSNDKIIL